MDSPEILLDDPAFRSRLHTQATGEPGGLLRSLKIKLLSTCNLRCGMCRYWRIPRRALPLEVVCTVLDDASRLGCRKVHLSGGEVTLYPDLLEVIRHAARKMRVNLTTNGVLLDRAVARAWIDAGLHAVSVSLDGPDRSVHDPIRGVPGAFDQAIKGIRTLRREVVRRDSKLRLRINTVVQRRNLLHMPAMLRLAVELGANDVVPMPVDGASADRPSREEIRAYNETIAPEVLAIRQKFGLPISQERIHPFGQSEEEITLASAGHYALGHYDRHLCYAPWLHTFISHLGDVFACCMTNERMPTLGNVRKQSLAEIFLGPVYERFRQDMRKHRLAMCGHCDQFLAENRLIDERLGAPAAGESGSIAVRWPLPMVSVRDRTRQCATGASVEAS